MTETGLIVPTQCMEAEEAMRKSYSHADPNVNSRLASSREPTSRLQLGEEEEVGWTRKGSRGMRRGRGAISKGRGIRSRGGSRASTKKQQDCIVPDSAGRPGGGCGDMSNMTALPSGGGLGAAGILMWRSLQVITPFAAPCLTELRMGNHHSSGFVAVWRLRAIMMAAVMIRILWQ